VDAISVTHTDDGLKAFLFVPEGMLESFPSLAELRLSLSGHGIAYGIDDVALERMANDKTINCKVEIAHGTPPVDGTPGRIDILVDVASRGKPRALSGGRVDHRDLGYVINVRKNTQILRRFPPVPGTEGKTVFGKPIGCRQAPYLALVPGPGTRIMDEDPNVLIADKDGAVAVFPNGKAAVLDEKVVHGNIDYATGNVSFMGNLQIQGTVRGGFEVEAAGNIWIGGSVEDAKVTAGGDLEIVGGASGSGNGALKCGGTLKARHFQNFSAQALNIEVLEDMVHCTVWAEQALTGRSIVGGTISAGISIGVDSIGTSAEPRTVIDLGGMTVLLNQKYDLLKDLAAVTAETGSIKGSMFHLVKDEMDKEGMLPPGVLIRLDEYRQKSVECVEKSIRIQKDVEAIDEKLKKQSVPVLLAKTVYPNTLIKAGSFERNIKDTITNVQISVDQNGIIVARA
jgi:uncharacterized protein (DUF342 family)